MELGAAGRQTKRGTVRKLLILLFIVMSPAVSLAHQPEEGKLMLTVGPHVHRTFVPPEYHITMTTNVGFGVLVEGDIDENGGLEVGLFYMKKSYHQNYHGTEFVESIKRIHIPVGYRHWWTTKFSSGLSFYSAYSIGDPRPLDVSQVPPGFQSAARKATKYGFDISMLWEVANLKDYTVVVDGRLSLALAPRSGEHSSHYGVMCGLKLPL